MLYNGRPEYDQVVNGVMSNCLGECARSGNLDMMGSMQAVELGGGAIFFNYLILLQTSYLPIDFLLV